MYKNRCGYGEDEVKCGEVYVNGYGEWIVEWAQLHTKCVICQFVII